MNSNKKLYKFTIHYTTHSTQLSHKKNSIFSYQITNFMDPSQNNYFSQLLTGEGSTLYSPFYTEVVEEGHPIELSQSATQQVSSQETPTTKKKKAYMRSENWTVHEDKLLVSAWLNTSQDSIQGMGNTKISSGTELTTTLSNTPSIQRAAHQTK